MNQVDLFIIVVVLGFAFSGSRRGLISSAGDIISIAVALGIGSIAYPLGAAPIAWALGFPPNVAGPLGYLVIAVLAALGVGWGCSHLAKRFEPTKHVSRVGGAAFAADVRGSVAGGPSQVAAIGGNHLPEASPIPVRFRPGPGVLRPGLAEICRTGICRLAPHPLPGV